MRRIRSHDDAALIMIIDIICFLFDDRSSLYEWPGRFLELQPVLKSHGLLADRDSMLDGRRAFFHHVVNGLCIYSDACGCYQSCGLSSVQISYGVFSLLSCASAAVKSLACQSIGSFSDFDHQSRTRDDVLQEYRAKLSTSQSLPAESCFFAVLSSSSLDLSVLLAVHGLSVVGSSVQMRQVLVDHIYHGDCFKSYASSVPDGCVGIRAGYDNGLGHDAFPAAFLYRVMSRLPRKDLLIMLRSCHVECDNRWSLREIRRHVQTVIDAFNLPASNEDSAGDFIEIHDDISSNDLIQIRDSWPETLSTESKNSLIMDFKHRTCSHTLKLFVCACCGENMFRDDCHEVSSKDIDFNLFRPQSGGLPMELPYSDGPLSGLLLCPEGVHNPCDSTPTITVCSSCWCSLRRSRVPNLAFANDTYLGSVPVELQDLTFVEELMIGLCRAKCCIFQLTENKNEGISPISQTAFRGHVIVYPQNPSSVAPFLPPSIDDITSLICILFIGSSKPTLKWLHERARPLAVRANKVRRALLWLKNHNALYHNVPINESTLSSLPSDGILPFHVEYMESSCNQHSLTSSYDNMRTINADDNCPTEIPFERLVISDVEGHITSGDLRLAAVNHVRKNHGSFLTVPHGSVPENEFDNPSLFPRMFPTLFPYGIGGFEDGNRKYNISFKHHVKHLLNLHDKCFQMHHSFSFIVFNMLQRRTVLLHTHLRMKRSTFASAAEMYDTITSDSIERLADRIRTDNFNGPWNESDRKIHRLMQDVRAINSYVPGSSSSRLQMRNEIRALTTQLGVPSYFITINPANVYCPVLKYLAEQNIDIDNLQEDDVPNYWQQACLISRNPTITAKFFNIFVEAFIKSLLKADTSSEMIKPGALGYVKGYYGCVEAQGRGSLHCHMLVWIEGALNPDDLKTKILTDLDFKTRLMTYLEDTISTSVPDEPCSSPSVLSDNFDPVSIRGLNKGLEYVPNHDEQLKDLHNIVERCQRHVHNATCYKYWKGPPEPKQCRFELDTDNTALHTTVDDTTGEITFQHLDGLINNFNSVIIQALRCNMDLKFIGSGVSAKAILYYITDYIAKNQLKSHVAYSLLEAAIRKMEALENVGSDNTSTSVTKRGKQLLQKCAHALVSQQELSSQQVASYLLDLNDHYTSHGFKPLYWTAFECYVNKQSPSPECYPQIDFESQSSSEHSAANNNPGTSHDIAPGTAALPQDETIEEDEIRISVIENKLAIDSFQQTDYIFRSTALDLMCLWDFVAQTIKEKSDPSRCKMPSPIYDRTMLFSENKSRPTFPFLSEHDQHLSHILKIKHPKDRCVPTLIGSPPRADREDQREKYSRFVLILFKPWKRIMDLRHTNQTWSSALDDFLLGSHCTEECRNVIKNMRLLHECKDSHDYDYINRIQRRCQSQQHVPSHHDHDSTEGNAMDEIDESVSIIEHLNMIQSCFSEKNQSMKMNADDCTIYAKNAGVFAVSQQILSVEGIVESMNDPSSSNLLSSAHETEWKSEYEKRKHLWKSKAILNSNPDILSLQNRDNPSTNNEIMPCRSTVASDSNMQIPECYFYPSSPPLVNPLPSASTEQISVHLSTADDIALKWTLTAEQKKAFQIIVDHASSNSDIPLKMFLNGPAGTGKSRIINAVKDFFDSRGEQRKFRLSSYMGIAAKNINGMTLHQLLSLNTKSSRRKNSKALQELKALWEGVMYLFIDEISMIGCKFLSYISETLCLALGDTRPFGGLSVIFAGDFAQLPPVKTTRLYARIDTRQREQNLAFQQTVAGKMLWLSVDIIIQLKHLHRQQGSENARFQQLLSHMREGRCNTSDFDLLNTRVLSPAFNVDFSTLPWRNTPIVVYDNATKDSLNVAATEAFARQTGQELHWYYASDFYKKNLIEDDNLINSLQSLHSGETNQRLTCLPLVLGMPVLVSHNFSVEDGVVNGARGIVKQIRFYTDNHGCRHLTSVIVHIPDSSSTPFSELSSNEYPILPDSTDFQMNHPYNRTNITILRHQILLQPAFAMTAHRSQGQTLPRVIIDYQSCKGTEAPYVMTSRVRSLNDLLILRPFEHKKICCHASEDYRIEQRRLSLLASELGTSHCSHLSINIQNADIHDLNLLAETQSNINNLTDGHDDLSHNATTSTKRSSPNDDNIHPSKRSKH